MSAADHGFGPARGTGGRKAFMGAFGLLLLGGVLLGTAPAVVKATGLPADVSAFFRVAIAAPALVALAALPAFAPTGGRTAHRAAPVPRRLYALAAVFFAADLAVMHLAIELTTVANATLFTNCAPLFVGLYGLLGFARPPDAAFYRALPLALAGIGLLIGLSGRGAAGGSVLGDGLGLLAGGLYAAYLVSVHALRSRGAASAAVMAWTTLGSVVVLLPVFAGRGFPVPGDPRVWALLLVLALVGHVGGQGLVTVALRTVPAALGALLLLVQPVVAALMSAAWLGESLGGLQITGIALVLSAVAMVVPPATGAQSRIDPPSS